MPTRAACCAQVTASFGPTRVSELIALRFSAISHAGGASAMRAPVGQTGMADAGNGEMPLPAATEQMFKLRTLAGLHGGGCYLGSMGAPVFGGSEQCVLVLGPPRSGKTSGVVVPNVLAARSVVVASTKRDVLDATYRQRRELGHCLLYDPSGATAAPPGVRVVGWSPLEAASSWPGAVVVAESMVGAARPDHHGESAHWNERAAALLACLLHAAQLGGVGMDEMVSWVNRREPEAPMALLGEADVELAVDVLTGLVVTDHRELSGIWSTASSVLAAYRTAPALESTTKAPIDFAGLIEGGDTLYVVASAEHQRHLAPLIAGLVRDLRARTYARRPPGPVTLVLDELANIAPLHDLPELVSEGGSHGLLTLACLQDLSQARARWGQIADGFLSLFGYKIILGGLADPRTLQAISTLAGERDAPLHSASWRSPLHPTQHSLSSRRSAVLPLDAIAKLAVGTALLIDRGQMRKVELAAMHATRALEPRIERRVGEIARTREGLGR